MSLKKKINILKFPTTISESERQVEAILFSADEPLDVETIKARITIKCNVLTILETLKKQYQQSHRRLSIQSSDLDSDN